MGKSYWRGKDDPFNQDEEIDYFILTEGGKRIFQKALINYKDGRRYLYARVSGETPLLNYYEQDPEYKVCIGNNKENCVYIVKNS